MVRNRALEVCWCLWVLLGGLVTFQVIVWTDFERDQRYLAHLMDVIASPALPPTAQAQALVGFLKDKPPQANPSFFLIPAFAFLRPTAREVAEKGGDCADRSRFMVVMLKLHGIHAAKWALYSPDLRPAHAVVEVSSELGPVVVDPLYGLTFPKPGGGYYGIKELRDNPAVLYNQVLALRASHSRPGTEDIARYPLNLYVYSHPRTINWDKSLITRDIYHLLHAILGQKVDLLTRPEWAEQPALMLLLFACAVELAAAIGLVGLFFKSKHLKVAIPGQSCRALPTKG